MHSPKPEWFSVGRIGFALLVIGVLVSVSGYVVTHPEGFDLKRVTDDFYANLGTELVSIAVTVLIIDTLNRRHDEERELRRLMSHIRNPHHEIALQAIDELRAYGWLESGKLKSANLYEANLSGANLSRGNMAKAALHHANLQGSQLHWANLSETTLVEANLKGAVLPEANLSKAHLFHANLHGADLLRANLQGANLTGADLRESALDGVDFEGANLNNALLSEQQLMSVASLRGATMPDGKLYNGCFGLAGDIEKARRQRVNINDKTAMASWYGVPITEYQGE